MAFALRDLFKYAAPIGETDSPSNFIGRVTVLNIAVVGCTFAAWVFESMLSGPSMQGYLPLLALFSSFAMTRGTLDPFILGSLGPWDLFTSYRTRVPLYVMRPFCMPEIAARRAELEAASRDTSLAATLKSFTAGDKPGLFIGGLVLPWNVKQGAIMGIGLPGSGKSLALDWIAQQELPHVVWQDRDTRALVFDAKRDLISKLQSIGIYDPVTVAEYEAGSPPTHSREPIDPRFRFDPMRHRECLVITDPWDKRCLAWDMAKDFDHYGNSGQLSDVFTAGTGEKSEFFVKTSQALFGAAYVALFQAKPGTWTLRDLLLTFSDGDDMAALLSQYPDAEKIRQRYLGDRIFATDTGPSVWASLHSYLENLEPIAAIWHNTLEKDPTRRFSLKEWTENNSVVLLGSSVAFRKSITLINRMMFHKAAEELLEHPEQENPDRTTWVFLDELPSLGYLTLLGELVREGRSRGVRAAYAFQSVSGLVGAMGRDNAKEITALAGTFGSYCLTDADDAEAVSKMFRNYQGERGSVPLVDRSAIQGLKLNVRKNGVESYWCSKYLDERQVQRHRIPYRDVQEFGLPRVNAINQRLRGKGAGEYQLKPWSDAERRQLGLDTKTKPLDEVRSYEAWKRVITDLNGGELPTANRGSRESKKSGRRMEKDMDTPYAVAWDGNR